MPETDAENKYKALIHTSPLVRQFLAGIYASMAPKISAITPTAFIYMKGGNNYALLMKQAREVHRIPNIPEEITEMTSDWDCGIEVLTEEDYKKLAVPGILKGVVQTTFNEQVNGPRFKQVIDEINTILRPDGKQLDPDYSPQGIGRGTERNRQGFCWFSSESPTDFDLHGFCLGIKPIGRLDERINDDVRDDEERYAGSPRGPAWRQPPLIDMTLAHPIVRGGAANPNFLKKHHLIDYTIDTLDGKTALKIIGYDEMWLDLMRMTIGETEVPDRKAAKRAKRLADLLRYIFCTPSILILSAPIERYELLLKLVERTREEWYTPKHKQIKVRGPGICTNTDIVGHDFGAQLTETLTLITTSCRPDIAKLFGKVIVELVKKHTIPSSHANIPFKEIENGFAKKTTDAEKCDLLKRMYVTQASWYANPQFHWYVVCAMGLFLIQRNSNPKTPISYLDTLVECAIKGHDFYHYRTLTLNSLKILKILDEVCSSHNAQLAYRGRQLHISIAGGYGFAFYLGWFMGFGQIFTGDMDVSFYPNWSANVGDIDSTLIGRLRDRDRELRFITTPEGATGLDSEDLGWSGSRHIIHYGYITGQKPFLSSGMVVEGAVKQHILEVFFQTSLLTTSGQTKDPRYENVYYASIPDLIRECDRLVNMKDLEPYKRKKYRLRSIILNQIIENQPREAVQANLNILLDTELCDAGTKSVKDALMKNMILPELPPGERPLQQIPVGNRVEQIQAPVPFQQPSPEQLAVAAQRGLVNNQRFFQNQQQQDYAAKLEAKRAADAAVAEANRVENEEAAVRQANNMEQDNRLNTRYLDNLDKNARAQRAVIDNIPGLAKLPEPPAIAQMGERPRDQLTPAQLANLEKKNQNPNIGAYQQLLQDMAAAPRGVGAFPGFSPPGRAAYPNTLFPPASPGAPLRPYLGFAAAQKAAEEAAAANERPAQGMAARRARDERVALAERKAAAAADEEARARRAALDAEEDEEVRKVDAALAAPVQRAGYALLRRVFARSSRARRLPSLPTRRGQRSSSSSKRRYTHRRRASRTGKGGYRPTKSGRKA